MFRRPRIDLLRGLALLMMVAFHGCYDLTYFGYAHFSMLDNPLWLGWRTLILSSFVCLAGMSLMLSQAGSRRSAMTRVLQLAACAVAVSAVTSALFGPRWIYFGVLHFFVVATLLTLPLLRYAAFLGIAGLVIVVIGWRVEFEAMNPPWFNWVGLAIQKPQTEDYAPLVPWLGLLWISAWVVYRWPGLAGPRSGAKTTPRAPAVLQHLSLGIQFLGRHSLAVYMLHQPLLFGILLLAR